MGWDAWFTIAILVLCFSLLAGSRIAPDIVMMAGLTLLLVAGVISPGQALSGFANEGLITVGTLYIVVTGLRETGAITYLAQFVLGKPRSIGQAQMRITTPTALISAFMNNIPVVAMMVPVAHEWAKRHDLSVSRLLMPLSYAAIAGGTCTLIGTSTNLVVNGLLMKETGSDSLSMFEIAWVGVPCVILTLLYIRIFSPYLLADRLPAISHFENAREYTVEMLIETGSALDGKTVVEAGLRQLPNLFLIEINRNGRVLPAVSSQDQLAGGDRLVFAGVIDSVVDLQHIPGLKPATNQIFKLDTPRENRVFIEAVVSDSCPIVGKTIKEGRFRTLYNAAIIAVARNGERINAKLGDIVLRSGDTLLLESSPAFVSQQRNSRDFLLVSSLGEPGPARHDKMITALFIVGLMVIVVASGLLSILKAAMIAAGLMIITRCTTGRIARRAVDWQVIIVIGASLGIGNALYETGAAQTLANNLITLTTNTPWVTLIVIYAITACFSLIITNIAAAVIMFPISLAVSTQLDVSILPFVIAIMMAASTSFATPIGYQTNLMVYGPGGYHFTDYLRFGLPLTILVGCLTLVIIPYVWVF